MQVVGKEGIFQRPGFLEKGKSVGGYLPPSLELRRSDHREFKIPIGRIGWPTANVFKALHIPSVLHVGLSGKVSLRKEKFFLPSAPNRLTKSWLWSVRAFETICFIQ